jgi:hypothetical protein
MEEPPKVLCLGPCGRMLPRTREYFTSSRSGDGLAKECHECARLRSKRNRMIRLGRLPREEPPKPERIRCSVCHHSFPATTEHFYEDHPGEQTGRLKKQCKACYNRYKQRKETCAACGTNNGNMRGDVDLATGHRYGILCSKCNTLVAASKGDAERMSKVARYLRRTRNDGPSHATETGHQKSITPELYPKENLHDREE